MKSETRTINGHQWRVTAWPARKALRIKTRLAKIVGPSLGALFSGADSSKGMMEQDLAEVGLDRVASLFAEQLDEQTVVDLVIDMMDGHVAIDDNPVNDSYFDQHFSANFGELYQGLRFVLEVNFGGFLDAVRSIAPAQGQSEHREG